MKRFNPDKELKKAQKKGIYNPRNKMFTIVLAVVLVVFISSSFAWFTSTSGSLGAFSGKANKKLTISVVATNGSVSTSSKTVNYKATTTFTVTPNSGYVYDSVSCTNSQTSSVSGTTLTVNSPTSDTTCTVNFKIDNSLRTKIVAANTVITTAPTSEAFSYGEPSQRKGVSGKTYQEYEDAWIGSISSSSNKAVGSSYTFDTTTGYFTLSGTTATSVRYSSSYVGYYTCGTMNNTNNNTSNCEVLYKIETVSGRNVTKATRITSGFSTSGSGLFSAPDDEGTSYYYRGEVNNNYVSFGTNNSTPLIWRIVRINGDGTVRLVLNQPSTTGQAFNSTYRGYNYVGYTNVNKAADGTTDVICTKDSPCISDYNPSSNTFESKQGNNTVNLTASDIKTYLENWYKTNLASYNDKIALSSYCNDTSTTNTSGIYSYGSNIRLRDRTTQTPILTCPDTNLNYGGTYKLKIGLLSADEMNMAGYGHYDGNTNYTTPTNYLYHNGYIWTGSPVYSYTSIAYAYHSDYGRIDSSGSVILDYVAVHPVINLKSDVQVASGDGTKDSPYVIE